MRAKFGSDQPGRAGPDRQAPLGPVGDLGHAAQPRVPGPAVFGKTQIIHEQPMLNRVARLQGRTTPRPVKTLRQALPVGL
jgi:hypothetical protein